MKPIMWVGILLVVLGALAVAYQGFNYTHQEKILDVGPIHATAEEHDRVSIPPVLGASCWWEESSCSLLERKRILSSKRRKCPA